jgi:hypothetical protein
MRAVPVLFPTTNLAQTYTIHGTLLVNMPGSSAADGKPGDGTVQLALKF